MVDLSTLRYSAGCTTDKLVLVSACRTPIGSYKGSYKDLSAVDIAAEAVKSSLHSINGSDVQALYAGIAMQGGLGQAPDKQIVIKAGLPASVVSATVNKVCASGMKIIQIGCDELRLGRWDQCVACVGAENMTRSTLSDGLEDGNCGKHMGELVAALADELEITREMQDEYAISSYERAQDAWNRGIMKSEICSNLQLLDVDEELKKFKREKIPTLRLAFGNSITAANASSLGDGAAVVLLCTESWAKQKELKVLAEVVMCVDSANEPERFGIAPEIAVRNMAKMCKFDEMKDFVERIKLWEINEAFSAVALANMTRLGLDRDIVNVHGGAVAIGHPLGMSGTRIVAHMAHNLRNKGDLGVCAICNGGGGASALLLRKL